MLINCICGQKTFEVDDHEIPLEGRQVKCGECSKEWFYNPEDSKLESNDLVLKPTFNDQDIPNSAEDIISQAERSSQTKKINNKIFNSKENVDQRHIRNIKFFIFKIKNII